MVDPGEVPCGVLSISYFHYKSPPPDYNEGHTLRFD
jgi:hypothetical protein